MFSWHYIQGAADDEENWSLGLTPSLYWAHQDALLEHDSIESCAAHVQQLLELAGIEGGKTEHQHAGEAVASSSGHADADGDKKGCDWAVPIGATGLSVAAWQAVPTSLCVPETPTTCQHTIKTAAQCPSLAFPFPFVLNCAVAGLPLFEREGKESNKTSVMDHTRAQEQRPTHQRESRSSLCSCSNVCGIRHLHIPIRTGKRKNAPGFWQGEVLPRALDFVGAALGVAANRGGCNGGGMAGEAVLAAERAVRHRDEHRCLIVCSSGRDFSVAIALAALVAFCRGDSTVQPPALALVPEAPVSTSAAMPTKESIRLALVGLQQHHPHALVPRRLLKELNVFFLSGSGSRGAALGHDGTAPAPACGSL